MRYEHMLLQFAALTSETIKEVRDCCINQVLGTDMKKHFDITSRFQVSCAVSPGIKSFAIMLTRTTP